MSEAAPDEKPKAKRQRNPKTPTTKGRTFTKLKLPDGLTVQEEGYARARAFGMSQLEAMALITGGKTKSVGAGSHYEKKPHVKARIEQLRQEITERAVEKASVDRAWVLSRLKTVVNRCLQEEPVIKNGEPTGEYKFDSAGANRSLELLGKELGMFVERKQIQVNPLESLSDDDLMRIAADLAKQTGMTEVIDVETRLLTDGEALRDQDAA
jgi:phage terminase small subunit